MTEANNEHEKSGETGNSPGEAVNDLKLEPDYRARVRLTGPVAIQDEEFGTLKENAELNALVSLAFLIGILWLALRSSKIILAVLITIFVGLSFTAAVGLAMVGSLNPISIAFAVLFVGIGVDFGIQFSVRYREERYKVNHLKTALTNAARHAGVPLTLAAAATAAGFLSFLPTDYKGLSELGRIAGVGMIIAFIFSVTLLPALLKLLNPAGEIAALGYQSLAPIDRFMERRRIPIIIGTAVVSLAGLPLLYFLQFDFNPVHLRSASVESISTYLDLRKDPNANANAIDIMTPNLAEARQVAERIRALPDVERVVMLEKAPQAEYGGNARYSGTGFRFVHGGASEIRQFIPDIDEALSNREIVGGRFDVQLDSDALALRLIGALISIRSRISRTGTGDQAIFVRRQVFERLGGFPELELCEDLEFSRRLKRAGRVACLRSRVITSARRWSRDGLARTVLRMWVIRAMYLVGVSPARLKRMYADVR